MGKKCTKFSVSIIRNLYTPQAHEVVSERRQFRLPEGLWVKSNSSYIEIGFTGDNRGCVNVYKNTEDAFPMAAQVNWSACGSQNSNFARLMAKALELASDIADEIEWLKEEPVQ